MATQRYHIASWDNPDGTVTAMLLDYYDVGGTWPTAIAESSRQATEQLRNLLRWRAKHNGWMYESDIEDPATIVIRVDVRPEHQLEDRVITFPDTVAIPVVCIVANRGEDLCACMIPALQLSFEYIKADDLKTLVQQYVQQHVKGFDTRRITRLFRPEQVTLDTVAVRVDGSKLSQKPKIELPALGSAADPVDAKQSGGSSAWSRDAEIKDLLRRVESERVSVLVVGPPGIGKTTVINAAALASKRERKQSDEIDAGVSRYWRTSAARVIAGMRYLGQWEQRCEEVVDELGRIDGVLCIDNLLDLLRVGGSPAQSPAAFFAPYIEHGELRMIAEVTEEELDVCRRLLPSLASQMQVLRLDPWPRATAIESLCLQAQRYAERFRTAFEPTVPEMLHRLISRFLPQQAFPGRAVALLQDAFTFARSLGQAVDNDIILDRFAEATGLPEVMLRDDMPLNREDVLAFMTDRVVGQDEASGLLADLVVTFKAAMNDTGRPIGVMLLCGPTGVGKTESAKALADFLFPHLDEKQRMIRIDMSEFSGPNAVARLIAQPTGEPSELIRRIRQQPFNVLLLDEIEKADAEVFDLLLGVLDEGRLVDTYGRATDFRCSFILMTSNIAGDLSGPFGFAREVRVDASTEVLNVFRPEFFNRLDAVVHYRPLDAGAMQAIARLHLGRIDRRQGLDSRKIRLRFSDRLVAYLAEHGFDQRYGARPLQRMIEEFVVTPLAQHLVEQPELQGVEIRLDERNGSLHLDAGDRERANP